MAIGALAFRHGYGLPLVAALAGGLTLAGGASAQTADHFFETHTLTLGASSDAGGSYDAYMHVLARHIGRFIPGSPTVIVQDVPAGGGMDLANRIYNTAPKDGSFIGVLHGSTLQEEVYRDPAVQFEGTRFAWIGNMLSEVDTCVASASSGIKSTDDFFTREVILGATGAGAQSYSFPILYNAILGTKFKVIPGYPGTPERVVAMERGEIDGGCGISTTSFRSVLAPAAKDGKVLLIAQAGGRKDPRYPDVVNMLDLAKTPEDHQALQFVFAPLDLGRPMAAPPETPSDRLVMLRRAFDATMKDPEFLDDAAKMKIDIDPMDAAMTAETIGKLFTTPKPVVDRIAAVLASK
jgi:tripartite-type tricarboxylate transporter receptor subunit TctC